MPRPRSTRVSAIKLKIIARLRDGFHHPGQRFLSNRAVAQTYGLSYQTAHRLMAELHAEGWLERAAGSGSYVSGEEHSLAGVLLTLHPRAQRAGSFGAQLRTLLAEAFAAADIDCKVAFAETAAEPPADRLPIFWDCRGIAALLARRRRFAILLNERPPPGLAATLVDSFAADDYSGGASAAQLLVAQQPRRRPRFAVLAGPRDDPRSAQRVEGFLDHAPKSDVVSAGTWFAEQAGAAAQRVARRGYDGVFCCNDRLAEALAEACARLGRPCPALVGFDDAPIAETLALTTIAIPWETITAEIVALVRRRLAGDATSASQRIFAPHPVVRFSHVPAARDAR